MPSIEYRVQDATALDIERHLAGIQINQTDVLLNIADIPKYAEKLASKAMTYEAWSAHVLIGLVAAYFDGETGKAFITNVSVSSEFTRNNLADTLMQNFIKDARTHKMQNINLACHINNTPARKLYEKHGFTIIKKIGDEIQMQKFLGEEN